MVEWNVGKSLCVSMRHYKMGTFEGILVRVYMNPNT